MLFTTLCTGWILKKRARKIVFAQKCANPKIGEKNVYIPPLTPDQPPLKGGHSEHPPAPPGPSFWDFNPSQLKSMFGSWECEQSCCGGTCILRRGGGFADGNGRAWCSQGGRCPPWWCKPQAAGCHTHGLCPWARFLCKLLLCTVNRVASLWAVSR